MKSSIVFFISLTLLTIIGCVRKLDVESEKEAVKSVIDQFYNLYIIKDADLLDKIVAHDNDMVNFGTDSVEHWVGWESLKQAFQRQWDAFEKPKISTREQVIKVSESGTVAWYSMLLDFKIQFKGKEVDWPSARTTGVLEKRRGKWMIVQFHNSMPVLKQSAEY